MLYLLVIIILTCIIIIYCILPELNRYFIFHPYKPLEDEYIKFIAYCNENKYILIDDIITHDNINLKTVLIKYNDIPKWTDKIFIFFHGNTGWNGNIIVSEQIKVLSQYGSVLIFDYRGFGKSDGLITELGLYDDALTIWNYITSIKNIQPENIILYGFSLGTTIASHLLALLIQYKRDLPQALWLEAPLISLEVMATNIYPKFKYLLTMHMNNLQNLNIIKYYEPNYPIIICHSIEDKIIPINHSITLGDRINSPIINLFGTHNEPKYTQEWHNMMNTLI